MIVIPMAGLSSRFFKAGYTKPKYMLEAHGECLFDHAVNSFKRYFDSEFFLFIVRDIFDTPKFVETRIKALGIKKYRIKILNQETRGQAETVYLGLDDMDYTSSITIFNIDTFRPDFNYPNLDELGDGYLEVFQGDGDNWSFAKPVNSVDTLVSETAEKNPISDLCSTGLYYFKDVNYFVKAYKEYLERPEKKWEKGELYIAPLYNLLIKSGCEIHFNMIKRSEVIFCGTPDEYLSLKK